MHYFQERLLPHPHPPAYCAISIIKILVIPEGKHPIYLGLRLTFSPSLLVLNAVSQSFVSFTIVYQLHGGLECSLEMLTVRTKLSRFHPGSSHL